MQEFLAGTEYVVDSVSRDGEHMVLAVWRYLKKQNAKTKAITYEYSEILNPAESSELKELCETLTSYAKTCLTALGIENSAAHTEIIINGRTGEPCLVETGARMHGCSGPKLIENATGLSLHNVLVRPEELFNAGYEYQIHNYCFEVDFHNFHRAGTLLKDIDHEKRVSSLP